ncbi:Lon protease [compost metagenome]
MPRRKPKTPPVPAVPLREMVVFPQTVVPLLIGRELSISSVQVAMKGDKRILLAPQRDGSVDTPDLEDLCPVATLAEVLQALPQPDGTLRIIVEGKERVQLTGLSDGDSLAATYDVLPLVVAPPTPETQALTRVLIEQLGRYLELNQKIPSGIRSVAMSTLDSFESLTEDDEAGMLADRIASVLMLKPADKQDLLQTLDPAERLEKLAKLLAAELEALTLDHEIHTRVRQTMDKTQREYYLKEKLKVIQTELNGGDERQSEIAELRASLERAKLPEEAMQRAERELTRLSRLSPTSAETGVIRTYLETLAALPWSKRSKDRLDLAKAEKVLEADHYGLDKVKERILEFLAVRKLRNGQPTTVLCLVGPPGVGKTSLAQSVAKALGREFVRVSLGGVHDEAEIRGHRRTYVGAMPGRILSALKQAGTKNPVFLLDEIEKMGRDHRGNPQAALLEVLDPEQNKSFSDHYLETPFDLSEVLFICTANSTHPLSSPLLDRMEVIRISGYTEDEKLAIAQRHLIPQAIAKHGLPAKSLKLGPDALRHVIRGWTREAGVRQLGRELSTLARKTARAVVGQDPKPKLTPETLPKLLGAPRFKLKHETRMPEVGVVNGLAWTEMGGKIMTVEVMAVKGKGTLQLTGQLGDVMRESAQAAYTYVKAHHEVLGVPEKSLTSYDLHLHVPAGAVPKDGPSAGIAITMAIASALSGRPIRSDIAMTGEITLRGRITAIGGLKEKLLAARRAEMRTVIIPVENAHDLEEIPEEALEGLNIVQMEHLSEALDLGLLPGLEKTIAPLVELVEDAPETQPAVN